LIRAVFWEEEGRWRGFELKGHAGYRPEGRDIVCAAVSSLAQTVALGLLHHLPGGLRLKKKKGYLRCFLSLESMGEEDRIRAQTLLTTLFLGLEAISRDYGKYVRIKRKSFKGKG